MELRVLQYFLAVANAQSISGAADDLHLTQPTLSRQLKDLEDEVGKQLLIRGSRRVTLTEEGQLLRRRAEEILQLVHKAEAELTLYGDEAAGEIAIGATDGCGLPQLSPAMRCVQQQHPGIRFSISQGSAAHLLEQLERGLLDLIILPAAADAPNCRTLSLPDVQWGLLVPQHSPLAALHGIAPGDLRKQPLIISRQAQACPALVPWLQEAQLRITCDLTADAALLCAQGLGCALAQAQHAALSGLSFLPLQPPVAERLTLAWQAQRPLSKAAEALLEQLTSGG